MYRHSLRNLGSLIMALGLLTISAQAVVADSLIADGDGLAPLSGSRMNLGNICLDQPTSASALVALRATGHPNNARVFENGTTVSMSASVLSGSDLAVTSALPSTVMAADWRSQGNGNLAQPVTWDVTINPSALGRYQGRIGFQADGVNRKGKAISRTIGMNVAARVVDCTSPVIDGMPASLLLEAAGPEGAYVDYVVPSATDAVDGPVPVICDPAPSSLVALGTSPVTCSAADRAGNTTSATFSVTIVDTTPPVFASVPGDLIVNATDPAGADASWDMPTATDLVDGDVAVTCDRPSGGFFSPGTVLVACRAADATGNEVTAAFAVEVKAPPEPDSVPGPSAAENAEPHSSPEPAPSAEPKPDSRAAVVPSGAVAGSVSEPQLGALPNTSMAAPRSPMLVPGLFLVALAAIMVARRRAVGGRRRQGH